MTRTREEIKKRVEELENKRFFLNMKDRWNDKDFNTDRELRNEILKLKRKLEEV